MNGSVWTLPYEVLMYASLLLGLLRLFGRTAVLAVPLALIVVHFHLPEPGPGKRHPAQSHVVFPGSALYLYRQMLPWNWKVALLLTLSLLSAGTSLWLYVHVLTLPYLTISLAHLKIPALSRFGR